MSNDSKVTISIDKRVFNNYDDLILFIIESLSQPILGNESLKKDTLELLKRFKALLIKGQHYGIYTFMLEMNLPKTLIDVIKLYISSNDVELYRAILSFFITITDNSEDMSDILSKSELPFILMDLTIKVCKPNVDLKLPSSVTVQMIIDQIILIIHNIARNDRFQQKFIEQENIKEFKDSLQPFLKCKDKRTCILIMAVLTWLAKEDEEHRFLLGLHSDIIVNFVDYINKGLKEKDRWYEGLHVFELLLVLQALSCMDTIQHNNFLTPKFMSVIVNILKSKSSLTKELEITLGIIWNLSFNENNIEKLKTEYKMEDAIKNLTTHADSQIRSKSLGFLWQLSKNHEPGKEIGKKPTKYDIFVSYCHAQNDTVKKVVGELKKKFKIWIDTEGIKGSGMNDMAVGIEQSKVIMMAVSTSYKQSHYCRSEAHYAFRLNKPIIPLIMERKYKPDGWLGMMICSDTYVDVSNVNELGDSLAKIEEHIYQKCNEGAVINITVNISGDRSRMIGEEGGGPVGGGAGGQTGAATGGSVRDWSQQDVIDWLQANELSDLEPLFQGYNGRMLQSMKQMMTDAFKDYSAHVKDELKLSFTQILRLNSAISDLKI